MLGENNLSGMVVDCCVRIHSALGPGLLESVYEEALTYEIQKRGLHVERQVGIPVVYESITMSAGFRADIIVENRLIVELKSVEVIQPVHKKQLLTYLKLADIRLGLLVNFNVCLMKDGIVRIVNNL